MKANPSAPEGLALEGASAVLRGLPVELTTACAARLASAPLQSQRGSRGILRQAPRSQDRPRPAARRRPDHRRRVHAGVCGCGLDRRSVHPPFPMHFQDSWPARPDGVTQYARAERVGRDAADLRRNGRPRRRSGFLSRRGGFPSPRSDRHRSGRHPEIDLAAAQARAKRPAAVPLPSRDPPIQWRRAESDDRCSARYRAGRSRIPRSRS